MDYPDRAIWLSQLVEIFGADCYGVRKLPASPRVLDVGANIGTFTLYALWRRPLGHVIAIEPDPRNIGYLRKNVARWTDAQVRVVAAAVGSGHGRTRISGRHSDAMRTGGKDGHDVGLRPLSEFLGEKIDLLKMDIEGAEVDALAGAGKGLANVGRIVFEYHSESGAPSRLPECLAIVRDAGFDRFTVTQMREFTPGPDRPFDHVCLAEAWRGGSRR